jgi:hypothetical protein
MFRTEDNMVEKQEKATTGRRDFLKLVSIGSVAGAATLATGGAEPTTAAEAKPEGGGYRETEHVRKFYDTARF